jgi:thiol-disulfide isomerase/thioredoxin
MIRRIVVFLIFTAILAGCESRNNISVSGTIEDPRGTSIKLWMVDLNAVKLIDSAKINSKGNFRLKLKGEGPEFYQVGYSQSDFVTLLIFPDDKIHLNFSDTILQFNYTIKGSDESEKIRQQNLRLAYTLKQLDSLEVIMEAELSDQGSITEPGKTEKEIYDIVMAQRNFSIDFILNNLNSLSSINAIYQKFNPDTYVLYDQRDLQILKLLTDTLSVKYPESRQVKAMVEDFAREMNNLRFKQLQAMAEQIEPEDVNPDLKTVEGKKVSLSSLKGKYVLLTFWASSSKECVSSNLQMKELYQRYRNKGFEIYQINLDQDTNRWKAAVRYDELPWISVREEDPENPRYAVIYNVKSLPTNYLYDRKGEIIGNNLHGRTLAIKLEQIFGF